MKVRNTRRSNSVSTRSSRGFFLGSASAAIAILSGPIYGANINWSGPTDAFWDNPANWQGGVLPGASDVAVMNVNAARNIYLNNTIQTLGGLLFNQASAYNIFGGPATANGGTGGFILSSISQTANVGNALTPNVTITTTNGGLDVLNANVTQNTLQLQGMITAGGVLKTGNGVLRLGTSGTGYNGAINGDLVINGGTLQVSSGNGSGVNNPMATNGAAAGQVGATNANVVIGASGVTFSTTHSNLAAAGAAVTYDWGRNIIANNNSFTWNADRAAGSANSGVAQVGTITLGNATLTTTSGNGFYHRTDGLIINSGATATVAPANIFLVDSLTGDATTKLIKNGGGDLRILSVAGAPATNFAGDIQVNQGWLVLESNAAGGQPLGAANGTTEILIGNSGVTVSLRTDVAAATTFNNTNIVAGNNSFTYDVRNITATNQQQMIGGRVSIGNATMTVGGDRHNLRISELNVVPGSTLTTLAVNTANTAAQNLTIDLLTGGGAGSVLRKTGGQTVTLMPSAGTYVGDIEHTGGTLTIQAGDGLVPTANVGKITLTNSVTLNLRSDAAVDYNAGISLGENVKNQAISLDRLNATGTAKQLRVGMIDITTSPTLGDRTLTINTANGFTFAADGVRIQSGNGTFTTNTDTTIDSLAIAAGSTLFKRGGSNLIVSNSSLGNSAGTIDVRAGTLTGNVEGAFGTGTVLVGNPQAQTTGFYTDFSRINWNAQGAGQAATGPDVIARIGGVIDLNVTPAATDTFEVQAFGRIQGTTAQLQALTVGTNLTLGNNAIVMHENPNSNFGDTVAGLPTEANLWYGLAANATSLPLIGAGTSWKGISGDNTAARTVTGDININGGDNDSTTVEAYLMAVGDQALNIGTGTVTWASTSGSRVTLGIQGTMGTSLLGWVPGGRVLFNNSAAATGLASAVDKIIVENGALGIIASYGLGGVPVEVRSNGSLDISGLADVILDGNVTIKSGGVLYLTDNQVLGSPNLDITSEGTITIEGGGKLDIGGSAPANIFTGSAGNGQAINFTGTGHTVRFAASNITGHTAGTSMDSVVPDLNVIYVVAGGVSQTTPMPGTVFATGQTAITVNTQTAGLTLDNGILTNDGSTRALVGPITLTANSNLTIAATRNTQFHVASDLTLGNGNLQIGSYTAIDGRDKSSNSAATNWAGVSDPYNSAAQVLLLGAVTANNVDVQNSHLVLTNAGTQFTGNLAITGGVLYLDGGGLVNNAAGDKLTSKLADGTLASKIIVNDKSRVEMGLILGSDGTRLALNQAFEITGDVNPVDHRSFWVSRYGSGTNTGVDFNNVALNAGSVLSMQESNTDIRVGVKLAGNATASTNHPIDYLDITRAASLPTFNGTNPVVLQQGRLNINGWGGSNSAVSNVYGNVGTGTQIDLVRGQLFFMPGSSIDGVIRTQTAAAGGDSFVVITSNGATTDTVIGGAGRIELGRSLAANGPEDLDIRGTEVASGIAPITTLDATVRIIDDGAPNIDGIIRSQRHNDSTVAANVAVNTVELTAGATGQITTQNAIPITVNNVKLLGNATIDTAAAGVTINNINAGVNTVTLQGASVPVIVNPITAGNLVVNGLNTMLSVANVSGNVTVGVNPGGTLGSGTAGTAGNLTANGNIGGSLTVDRSTASVSGSVGGGLSVTGGTVNFNGIDYKTVGGPASLDRANVNLTGIVDFGTNMIESTPSTVVAGLREQRSAGSFDVTTPNSSNVVKMGPVMANQTTGWGTNETYTYTGQFYVPDTNGNGTGSFAFAENFDDSVRLIIDGVQRLNNTVYNVPTGTGEITLPSGWHDFEARFGQGTGGAGPLVVATGGWDTTLGFGVDLTGPIDGSTTAPTRANFGAPLDGGTMNVFRTTVQSNLNLSAGAILQAGGVKNVGTVNFAGSSTYVHLISDGSATANSVDNITLAAGVSGSSIDIDEAGDTLTVGRVNLGSAPDALSVNGAGNLTVTGDGTGTGGFTYGSSGFLTVDGSLPGVTTMNAGILRGKGVLGELHVNAGVVAPTGVLTVGSFQANPSAVFHMDIGSALDGAPIAGVNYDQVRVTGSGFDPYDSMLALNVISALKKGDVFTLILNDGIGSTQGFFNGYANESLISLTNGYEVQISYFDDASTPGLELTGGNDVSLLVTVPEPGSAALILGGLGAMFATRRRRKA